MTLLKIPFPNISDTAFELGPLFGYGPFLVKWYGLAYMSGLLIGWLLIRRMLNTPRLWPDNKAPFSADAVDDLMLYMTIGVIVGGRVGQVLLYEPGWYFANPSEIFKVWKGGMSFHGGFVGSILACYLFARQHKVSFLTAGDLVCAVAPIGIFFGRLANFINAEHFGRATDVAWAVVFPKSDGVPRHPSQLYEAALEGLLLFMVLRVLTHQRLALRQPGLTSAVFLTGYGLARFFVEYFREPEPSHFLNTALFTAGQAYSLPMIAVGLWMALRAKKQPVSATRPV